MQVMNNYAVNVNALFDNDLALSMPPTPRLFGGSTNHAAAAGSALGSHPPTVPGSPVPSVYVRNSGANSVSVAAALVGACTVCGSGA